MNSELNEIKDPAPNKELTAINKTKKECDIEFVEDFKNEKIV